MQLGMIGLGRMGAGLVRRLMRDGHECVVFDENAPTRCTSSRVTGAIGASSLADFASKLTQAPRRLGDGPGRVHRRRRQRARRATSRPTTSSSTAATRTTATTSRAPRSWRPTASTTSTSAPAAACSGSSAGFCLMIGGEEKVVQHLDPIFATIAPGVDAAPRTPGRTGTPSTAENGYLHCGPQRRRALREDGPQRDRVRDHGRVRRRAGDPQRRPTSASGRWRRTPRPPRSRTRSSTSTTSTSPRWPRCGGAAAWSASWLLDLTAHRARTSRPNSPTSRAGSRTRVRAAGRSWPRSTRACPPRCSRPRCSTRFSSQGQAEFADKLSSAMRKRVRRATPRREWRDGRQSPSRPTRWSSSARPATSPTRRSSPRSTT